MPRHLGAATRDATRDPAPAVIVAGAWPVFLAIHTDMSDVLGWVLATATIAMTLLILKMIRAAMAVTGPRPAHDQGASPTSDPRILVIE